MGWKLGYITSLDGTRVKGAGLPGTMPASVVEEVGDEPAGAAKLSEYDGGWALSKGVGRVGSAVDSGRYPMLLSPSVVPTRRRPLVFSVGKIMSELESGGFDGEIN